MNVLCSAKPCPVLLSTTCVFYEGEDLIFSGINTNDSVQVALQKLDAAIGNDVFSVSVTSPLTITAGPNPIIGITQSSATVNGYLTSTDWSVFNGKQPQLNGTGFVKASGTTITYDNSTYYLASNPNNYIPLTALSSTATGLTYTNATGVFSLTAGYIIPTTTEQSNWNTAYTNRITSLTTTGSSGASTLISNVLNIPNYTLSGLGGVPSSRQLTINGVAFDLSADRSWSVGTVTSIATSGPITGGTITGSGTIGISQSSGSTDGYLSSTDWNTFNSKQPQLNGTGFVKVSGTTISYDNSTYYLASNPSAFIALTALSGGTGISYNNLTGVITNSAPDQLVSLTGAGTTTISGTYPNFTITSNDQYTGTVTGTGTTNFLPKWTGASSIGNSLLDDDGTSASVALALGGAFNIKYLSAIKLALTGGTTFGSIDVPIGLDFLIRPDSIEKFKLSSTGLLKFAQYGSGTVTGTATYRLAVDASGNVIEVTDGGGTVTGTGAAGQVAYWTGTSSQTGSNNLFWDAANARLGIGTNTPSRKLHVIGTSALFQNAGEFELDLLNTTSGNYLRLVAATADSYLGTIQNIPFSFIMNGSRVGQFTSTNGNLILQNGGTFTDGGERLQVNGTAKITGNTLISAGNLSIFTTNTPRRLNINQALGGNAALIGLYASGGSLIGAIGAQPTTDSLQFAATAGIVFYSGSTIGSIATEPTNERMRITSGGNLLVGTTADQGYRVQITGSGDNMLNVWGATAPSIRLDNAASGATQRFVIGLATATNNFIQGASAGDVCITTASASPIVFGMWQTSTASEVMRITTSNNLLINKTTDGGQKLQVSGKVNFASLPTSATGLSAGDVWNNGGVLNIV